MSDHRRSRGAPRPGVDSADELGGPASTSMGASGFGGPLDLACGATAWQQHGHCMATAGQLQGKCWQTAWQLCRRASRHRLLRERHPHVRASWASRLQQKAGQAGKAGRQSRIFNLRLLTYHRHTADPAPRAPNRLGTGSPVSPLTWPRPRCASSASSQTAASRHPRVGASWASRLQHVIIVVIVVFVGLIVSTSSTHPSRSRTHHCRSRSPCR